MESKINYLRENYSSVDYMYLTTLFDLFMKDFQFNQ